MPKGPHVPRRLQGGTRPRWSAGRAVRGQGKDLGITPAPPVHPRLSGLPSVQGARSGDPQPLRPSGTHHGRPCGQATDPQKRLPSPSQTPSGCTQIGCEADIQDHSAPLPCTRTRTRGWPGLLLSPHHRLASSCIPESGPLSLPCSSPALSVQHRAPAAEAGGRTAASGPGRPTSQAPAGRGHSSPASPWTLRQPCPSHPLPWPHFYPVFRATRSYHWLPWWGCWLPVHLPAFSNRTSIWG